MTTVFTIVFFLCYTVNLLRIYLIVKVKQADIISYSTIQNKWALPILGSFVDLVVKRKDVNNVESEGFLYRVSEYCSRSIMVVLGIAYWVTSFSLIGFSCFKGFALL